MATSTFDRKIEINSIKSINELVHILSDKEKPEPLSDHPYSDTERKKGDELLDWYLSHSDR